MALPKELRSVKRFGARYGRTTRHKFGRIEHSQRKIYKCPFCNKEGVKRVCMGIWQCKKCNVKFADQAYKVTIKA